MRLNKTPQEASAQLIEEGLRHAEFPAVEFRDSPVGRQAYVAGSTLAEHLSSQIVDIVAKCAPKSPSSLFSIGRMERFSDAPMKRSVRAAKVAGLTLVTYDQRTFPPLLRIWARTDQTHGGVVFVDQRTIASNEVPVIARSLITAETPTEIGTGPTGWPFSDAARSETPASRYLKRSFVP